MNSYGSSLRYHDFTLLPCTKKEGNRFGLQDDTFVNCFINLSHINCDKKGRKGHENVQNVYCHDDVQKTISMLLYWTDTFAMRDTFILIAKEIN